VKVRRLKVKGQRIKVRRLGGRDAVWGFAGARRRKDEIKMLNSAM
jgi:hypothetical protein